MKGRKLGRNGSHRKAMFRNMAASLIKTLDQDADGEGSPKVPGRIITTTQKAKELRPQIERLVTIARRAAVIEGNANKFAIDAERGSDEWKEWRQSEQWVAWSQAIAPAVAMRRRAYADLRDHHAVSILFSVLAERFADRDGGYTRILKLAKPRLGDAGQRALIEFVGNNDRVRPTKRKAILSVQDTKSDQVGASGSEENTDE
ncbi:MAG: 50S ribosomal protein L17 [Planctomycetota bacterium]|nr:50S ribosomal protein L17 [Planctomycetota bacterium]MDA0920534.1 50S ribosomal protein L17 [Planctomycetota bacterium]